MEIQWNGKKLQGITANKVNAVLRTTGLGMVREIKRSMTETAPRGEPQQRYKPDRLHTPSVPGKPPAVDQATLRKSIEMDASDLEQEGVVHVGSFGVAPYAEYLELGTATIAPRPFLRPALDRVERPLKQALKGILP